MIDYKKEEEREQEEYEEYLAKRRWQERRREEQAEEDYWFQRMQYEQDLAKQAESYYAEQAQSYYAEQLQARIAELEAEVANLNDWLTTWKESFSLAQAEIAKLQTDNCSLVEQMNQMALKQNQEEE